MSYRGICIVVRFLNGVHQEPVEEQLSYSEDYLMKVYEDLLALPEADLHEPLILPEVDQREVCKSIVEGLANRLLEEDPPQARAEPNFASSFVDKLLERHPIPRPQPSFEPLLGPEPRHRILARLIPIVGELEAVRRQVTPHSTSSTTTISPGIVSPDEWKALIRHSVSNACTSVCLWAI